MVRAVISAQSRQSGEGQLSLCSLQTIAALAGSWDCYIDRKSHRPCSNDCAFTYARLVSGSEIWVVIKYWAVLRSYSMLVKYRHESLYVICHT